MSSPQRATILFGHGSRDPLWHQPMQAVARQASLLDPQALVRCAYLELTEPDLPTCVQELAAAGVRDITITPMFLGVGRHAREDLPRLFDDLRLRYPQISFQLAASVGEDARVIELLARIAVAGP
jgi:sirohydrochlorin cobaltochelatase